MEATDTPLDPWSTPAPDLETLLQYAGVGDLDQLADKLSTIVETDFDIEADTVDGGVVLIFSVIQTGIELAFPFTLDSAVEVCRAADDQYLFSLHLESLPMDIHHVEGIDIEIEVDDEGLDEVTDPDAECRITALGFPLHALPEYRFFTPMSDEATFADWVEQRFLPTCPHLRPTIDQPPHTTLGELRAERPRRIPRARR